MERLDGGHWITSPGLPLGFSVPTLVARIFGDLINFTSNHSIGDSDGRLVLVLWNYLPLLEDQKGIDGRMDEWVDGWHQTQR